MFTTFLIGFAKVRVDVVSWILTASAIPNPQAINTMIDDLEAIATSYNMRCGRLESV